MTTHPPEARTGRTYRVEFLGEIDQEWASWFGSDNWGPGTVETGHGQTILTVDLADQAQLLGLLRRIHDLRLTLVSVQLVSFMDSPMRPRSRSKLTTFTFTP